MWDRVAHFAMQDCCWSVLLVSDSCISGPQFLIAHLIIWCVCACCFRAVPSAGYRPSLPGPGPGTARASPASPSPSPRSWSGHYKGVTCLAFTESGLTLLSGAEDTTACVWLLPELLDVAADASDPAFHRPQPLHSW